ncbi:hypothetical protein ACFW34_35325 [Streptomyces sp. NPDC058848]|uniref:hypothetical protein n=1 Tax=unclassified Streptomyces TaxID=2593676 RepID=UPI0036A04177
MPDRDFYDSPSLGEQPGAGSGTERSTEPDREAARRRRRAQFLRDRVQPRRAKTARLRHAMRMRTFRW